MVVRAMDESGNIDANTAELSATTPAPVGLTWTATASLIQKRDSHTTMMLPNGKVIVIGGKDGVTSLGNAEIYDPQTGVFIASGGSLGIARFNHSATLLLKLPHEEDPIPLRSA